jgi:hypothetical protein
LGSGFLYLKSCFSQPSRSSYQQTIDSQLLRRKKTEKLGLTRRLREWYRCEVILAAISRSALVEKLSLALATERQMISWFPDAIDRSRLA